MRRALPVSLAATAFAVSLAFANGTGSRDSLVAVAFAPSESTAKAALSSSSRHGEFVDIKLSDGGTALRTWVVYPEVKDKAGVVLLIHEVYGLSDWMRGVADAFAAEGFIAVAPDLISGMGPNGGGTESIATRDDVVKVVRGLTPEQQRVRLDATRVWAAQLPASNGKVATVGFCWGGARSFESAASNPPLPAVVFYGSSPDSAMLLRVNAPVLAHYGGDDARVNATIDRAKEVLAARKVPYEVHIYEGAGHGFLRQQDGREGANMRAARAAWPRTVAFLRQQLR